MPQSVHCGVSSDCSDQSVYNSGLKKNTVPDRETCHLLCPPDNQRLSVGASARDVVVCLSVSVCVLATFTHYAE